MTLFARWTALERSDRLRAIGWCVLGVGLGGAAVFYWIQSHSAERALDDTTALGYAKSLQHGVGVMMGPSGAILTDLQQNLTTPLGEALMIAVGAALVAGYFFRVAWVLDADQQDDQAGRRSQANRP
jgi:hypothetical protein